MIIDTFKDIVKHTHGLGFIDNVKLIGSNDDVKLEAMTEDRSVVMYGSVNEAVENLSTTVGLSRMGVLSGLLNFEPFSDAKATVAVAVQERNGNKVPSEITFNSNKGHTSNYRFMSTEAVEESIKVPPFRGVKWDVNITPSGSALKDLQYFSTVLGSYESNFLVKTNRGVLEFHIGTGPTDRSVVPFAVDVEGELKHGWSWPLQQVLAILKLAQNSEECVMRFSDQGALSIEVDSGLGKYQYILPAKAK